MDLNTSQDDQSSDNMSLPQMDLPDAGSQPAAPQDQSDAPPAPTGDNSAVPQSAPTDQSAPPDQTQPTDDQQQPTAPVAPPVSPVSSPFDLANSLKVEDPKFAADLTNGHITPETYSSLFAKKDTLGKIGTLFGLILGGGASGLTHQPNVVLDMMNKQITNDIDAQKTSKVNAQNLYKLNLEHQNQQAKIRQMDYENALSQSYTNQITAKTPGEVAKLQAETTMNAAQAKASDAQTAISADTLTHMQANRIAMHNLTLQVNKMPEGTPQQQAQKQQALQTLGLMSQSVDNMNSNLADKAAALQALNLSVNPQPAPPTGNNPQAAATNEQQFQGNQRLLRLSGHKDIADDNEAKHIPGVAGSASIPLSDSDRAAVQSGQALQQSIQRLKDFTLKNANSLDPRVINEGKALAAQVQGDFRLATHGGVYKEGEQNFIEQIVPGDPTKFLPKITVLPKLDAVLKETNARTNQFLQSKGLQGAQVQTGQVTAAPKEGATGTANGKPTVYKNGAWRYK